MKTFDSWLEAFNKARRSRTILSRYELRDAYQDGETPQEAARRNDEWNADYDRDYAGQPNHQP